MKCEEFDSKINELLDERRRPESDDAVRHHLAACAVCRKRLASYETLFDGLDLFEAPAISASFAANVVAAALVEPAPVKRRWLSWRLGAGILAAAAALLLLAALPRSTPPDHTAHNKAPHGPGLATIQAPPHQVAPNLEQPVAPRPAPLPSPSAAAVAIKNTPPALSEEQELERYRQLMENITPQLPGSPPVWMNHLAGGIRPVANTFGDALHVLRRTLPSTREESRPAKPSAERMTPSEFTPVA